MYSVVGERKLFARIRSLLSIKYHFEHFVESNTYISTFSVFVFFILMHYRNLPSCGRLIGTL